MAMTYGMPLPERFWRRISLLLSLEALFAVVSGAILLHERLTPREYLGCALMLCAVVLVQLPEKKSGATLT